MAKKGMIAKSAILISICTLLSKGLGFLRVVMIASRFGSGMETDTYNAAMTATVVIVGALGSALNTTLVPVFTKIKEKHGHKGKLIFLNNIINLVLAITIIMIIVGYIASPFVMRVVATGFEGEQLALAVRLNRIGLPIILFLGMIHILSGFLHSNKIFGPPAIAGIPYNIVFLVYLTVFASSPNIETLMVVTVIGTIFQFLIHVPATKNLGYRFRLRFNPRDRYLRETMVLVLPVFIGSTVQQINLVIDKTLGSKLATGSLSALDNASKLNEMVVAVFIMAITTVVFPMISESIAQEDMEETLNVFTKGVNIILLIVVPATVGLLLLAQPTIYLFFERGQFDAKATAMTSTALSYYALGLVGISLRLLLNRVFYALQDTVTPMRNGIIAVGINVIFNLILMRFLDHGGLALATSISATVTALLLFINLKKELGEIDVRGHLEIFLKTLIAAIIMGFVVVLVYYRLGSLLPDHKLVQMVMFILSIALGAGSYGGICYLLEIDELNLLLDRVKTKVKR